MTAVQAAAPPSEAAAEKARKPFDIFHFGRAQCRDVAIGKIGAVVESAGIAKISRRPKLGGETDAVAVMQERHRADRGDDFFGIRVWAINAQADAGMDGFSPAFRRFHLFRFDVNCLSHFLEGARLQAAVACDVGDDLQLVPVGTGLDSGVKAD
ncbi:MAG TPA: hypothetical protein VGV35_21390 [Bryobacteraceae bacterium]|nr:hypothetical protein [Bryobacteraceae bacterium]